MKKSKKLWVPTLLLGVLLLTGCGGTETLIKDRYVYVVQRDVPTSPTFVVLPQNDSYLQTNFAEQLEAILLNAGHRVINRPGPKLVEKETGGTVVDSRLDNVGNIDPVIAEATVRETYYALDEVDTDYFVYARAGLMWAFYEPNPKTKDEKEQSRFQKLNSNTSDQNSRRLDDRERARIKIVKANTGEVLSSFVVTVDQEVSEVISEAVSKLRGR